MTTEILKRELKINREVDASLNTLLGEMKEFVDRTRIYESDMEIHQMANLVAVAQETDSVEVVKHYIRYQIGRDTANRSWRWRVGGVKNFGEQLVDHLGGLQDRAQVIIAEAGGGESETNRTWIALTRLYLGHLRRYFYYLKRRAEEKEKGGERP